MNKRDQIELEHSAATRAVADELAKISAIVTSAYGPEERPAPDTSRWRKAARLPVLTHAAAFGALWDKQVPEEAVSRVDGLVSIACTCGETTELRTDWPVTYCECDRWFLLLEDGRVHVKRWTEAEAA